jgi:glycine/D-amino acid oxidase-like deaminating enzyme
MEKKYLIVGHGLAGCVLALTFYKRGIPFQLTGCHQPGEASMVSSGLIAPITGRRYVKAWLIDELIDKALEFYQWTENLLQGNYFFPVDIVRFLSNPESLKAWARRLQDPEYSVYISSKRFSEFDRLGRKYGVITGGYRLDAPQWLQDVRTFLISQNLLVVSDEPIEVDSVDTNNIIYAVGAVGPCTGIIPNKGEALIVRMPGWKWPGIVKEKVYFVPLKEKDMYWIGSSYKPWPEDISPSDEGKNELLKAIKDMHQDEVEIVYHLSGIRPTVDDRRPLIGTFPSRPGNYIFNGMGTKGTSLAPYWAEQLISYLVDGKPLPAMVDPSRYVVIGG